MECAAAAGLSWGEAWATGEQAVAERFARLPEYLQGAGLTYSEQRPLAALDPVLFAQVMAAQVGVVQRLRAM